MTEKFRPYLTAGELSEIILCLKSQPTPARLSIVRYLESFNLKIKHGLVSSAHTLQPSQAEKLGFHELTISPSPALTNLETNLKGEAAFKKWQQSPESCTPKEIAESLDWRYRNNLMTQEEEQEYEQSQLSQR